MINTGISFIAFLAIFLAFKCDVGATNVRANLTSQSYKGKGIVGGGNNYKKTVHLCHDKEIKTALSQIQKTLAFLKKKMSAMYPDRRGK